MNSKSFTKTLVSIGFAASLSSLASVAVAHSENDSVYLLDRSGNVVKSGAGLCWRDGYWSTKSAASDKHAVACGDKAPEPKKVAAPPPPPPPPPVVVERKPAPPPVKKERRQFRADQLFALASSRLKSTGRQALDTVVSELRSTDAPYIHIVGYADRIGKAGSNMRLSERRAMTVKNYLASKGVDTSKMRTKGMGDASSRASDKCRGMGRETGRNKKIVRCLSEFRRVDIVPSDGSEAGSVGFGSGSTN